MNCRRISIQGALVTLVALLFTQVNVAGGQKKRRLEVTTEQDVHLHYPNGYSPR